MDFFGDSYVDLFIYVCLVICGILIRCTLLTLDTNNDLEKEVGGYEHVVVLRNVKVVDGDCVDILQNLPRGTHNGDCIQDQFLEEILALIAIS